MELQSQDNKGNGWRTRVCRKDQQLVEACRNAHRMTAEIFLDTIMGVVSLMGYAGVTDGFLCAHPNVIVIVFKGRVKQDLQP